MDAVLPSDHEAESAVLGAMMLSAKAVPVAVDKLRAEDFVLPPYARIFQACRTLFLEDRGIDLVSLSAELDKTHSLEGIGGTEFLAELESRLPTASNVGYYADRVRDLATKRALIHAGHRTAGLGYDPAVSATVAYELAQAAIYEAWSGRDDGRSLDLGKAIANAWDEIRALDGKPLGIPTGLYDLDGLTSGLRPGNLILLAARPGVGKTALALQLAESIADKCRIPVGFFSMEMTASELVARLVSAKAQVDHQKLRSGDLQDVEWNKLTRAAGELGSLPITIDESVRLGTVELRARAKRLKMTKSIGLLVVDYLQLMDAPRADSRVQEVTEISRSLKALARELALPVIACSQLNREVEKRGDHRPQLADLRESGALEQDADLVLLLHRPGMYDGSNGMEAELIVAKHRNGPSGVVNLVFKPEYVRFMNKARRPS